MKRHVTIAVFLLALAAYSLEQKTYAFSQETTTQPSEKLSKKDRKKLEKEQKKADKQERKEEKHLQQKEAKERRKQYKQQEKQDAKQRGRELKEQRKQVASEQKKEQQYDRKATQRAEKEDSRDMERHIHREARVERAAVVPTTPRYVYVPRVPISANASPGLLLAQREVSRTIYSQLPSSDIRVLLDGGNRIVLRGPAPTPSLRQRLLQLAVGAARGYSVVDQLAANFVGDAASAATSAAIGGVSDLIHGSGRRDSGPTAGPEPVADSVAQAPVSPQQALPNNDAEAIATVLDPGSNACVNLSNSNQVLLTGQVASQPSAELVRQFAHQLASPSALITDQLAVRTTGVPSSGNTLQNVASTSGAGTTPASANSSATLLSPGSTVCVTQNNGEMFLTGTVGSTAELGTVENAVQPLVGSGRLLDHLTIATLNSAQIASTAPIGNLGATPPEQQTAVEQAVHSIPRLSNVDVQVTADGVHLSGSVDTMQDDQIAADLARQYAAGRPVLDNMTVANRTQPPQQ